MKSLFWDKVPDRRLPATFWASVKLPDYQPAFWQEIEQSFQQIVVKSKDKKVEDKPKAVNVLDLKKCTQIGIKIARLRKPWYEMRHAILSLDPLAFTSADDVQTVLDCVPTEEEKKTLEAFIQSGQPVELISDAEKFALELMKTKRCEARLRALLARFVIDEKANEALRVFGVHLHAIHEMQSSKCFVDLLLMALAIGNFMNHGTRLGNTLGFRLKGLNKLNDTRSHDGKTTIMQEIVKELCAREHKLLSEEMEHVMSPQVKVSLQEASDMTGNVEGSINQIRTQLKVAVPAVMLELKVQAAADGSEFVHVDLIYDSFYDVMSATLADKELLLTQAQEAQQQAKDAFEKMLNFFGETSTTVPNDTEFWTEMQTFVERVSASMRQIYQEKKDAEEREQRKRELELKRAIEEATRAEAARQRQAKLEEKGRSLRRNTTSLRDRDRGVPRDLDTGSAVTGEADPAAGGGTPGWGGRAMLRSKTFQVRDASTVIDAASPVPGMAKRVMSATIAEGEDGESKTPGTGNGKEPARKAPAGGVALRGLGARERGRERENKAREGGDGEGGEKSAGANSGGKEGEANSGGGKVADAATSSGPHVRFRLPLVQSSEADGPAATLFKPGQDSAGLNTPPSSSALASRSGLSPTLKPEDSPTNSGSTTPGTRAGGSARARDRVSRIARSATKEVDTAGEPGSSSVVSNTIPSPRLSGMASERLTSTRSAEVSSESSGSAILARRRSRSQSQTQGELGALADSMLELEVRMVLNNIVDELQMKELLGEL